MTKPTTSLESTDMSQDATSPAPAGTMRAIVQDRYGEADVLHLAEIARPEVADNEVLVRVHAAGLDRGTWHLMAGKPYLIRILGFGLRRPKNRVAGLDVAGTVVAVGSAVTRFSARGRGVRDRKRLVRRVRRGPRGQAGPQAGRSPLRAGRGRCRCRQAAPSRH